MDLTNIDTIKSFLTQYNVRPKRYMGQHFLIDQEVLKEILAAAEISPKDLILEIGPGLGVLTLELAKRAKKIIAVEKDEKMAEILKNILKTEKIANVEIIAVDILKILNYKTQYLGSPTSQILRNFRRSDFPTSKIQNKSKIPNTPEGVASRPYGAGRYQIPDTKYKVVANLPYYLTARIIRRFLESDNPPDEMILMVQKEVARRICAQPPEMNLLAVSVQFYARPEIAAFVSKKSFWPEPEVDSAIIKIKMKNEKIKKETDAFFKIVRAGFSSPRKKLTNNLANIFPGTTRQETENLLKKIGLRPDCRSQDLSVDNWRELVSLLRKNIV